MRSDLLKFLFGVLVSGLVLAPVMRNLAQGAAHQAPSAGPVAQAPAAPAAGSAPSAGPFTRHADPIVLKGEEVPDFAGVTERDIRVYAARGGKLQPIPCQMDERNQWGEFVVTKGKRVVADEDGGGLDENDEIVFLTRDLGERADKAQVPGGPRKVYEVEVTDPLTSARSYAYVATYAGNAPAPSTADYVQYIEQGEGLARGINYELGFLKVTSGMDFNHVAILEAAGGDGKNHMDKLKVRVMQNLRRGFTVGIPTRLDRTEKNFLVKVYGYKDGPVRVVRVMKVNLQLIWKLPAPGATVNMVFYPEWMESPVPMNLPFKPTWAFSKIEVDISNDFAFKPTDGVKFYTSNNPGVWSVVDGKMTPEETAWNKQEVNGGYFGIDASAIGGGAGFVTVRAPKSFTARILGLYRDDAELGVEPEYYKGDEKFEDRPEWIKGALPMTGNRFIEWGGVGRGIYTLFWYAFFPPHYKPGDEKSFLDIVDHPVTVTVQ